VAESKTTRHWPRSDEHPAIEGLTDLYGLKLAERSTATTGRDFDDTLGMVQVTLAFSVHDREAMWDAAAKKGLAAPGMRLTDVIDVIGPREDPAIAECVAMLAPPSSMAGCTLDRFDIEI